ncbi:BTAD domain-containing putative transcriptional regulator [Streptomyces diastatochromogenes]|uniref:AfsR/SARP family transcriptional regulator n=1 Tax=Streptomyces diastatochromogenes TaxID=42236 RepID=UPI002F25F103
MKIQVLGSVRITFQGRPVGPSSSRAKLLLAALAWQANEFVTDEVIIDRIWGEKIPQHPRDALYTCTNRLRSCLDLASGLAIEGRIVRRRGGYILECSPEAIDLQNFRKLAVGAQSAMYRGDDRTAADLFGRALGLWSGTAMCDIDSSWSDRVRTTLEQELLATQIGWVKANLALGRHEELIPHISYLVEENPFDEAIAGLYMLALHRAGRQKEAWEFYSHVRNHLVAQLGEEPGSELQEMHRLLLQREDHPVRLQRETMPVPRQLPPPVHRLNGRQEILTHLHAILPAAAKVISPVVIQGPTGVGKTTLAIRWSHDAARHFPDGQLYIEFDGKSASERPAPSDLLPGLLVSLGVPSDRIPLGEQAQTALYRSVIAERRFLILIDGADLSSEVIAFLPGSPGSMVLVTSRSIMPELIERYNSLHLNLWELTPRANNSKPNRVDFQPHLDFGTIDSVPY